jgi:hypothetical protein
MDDERIHAHDGPADPEQVESGFEEGSDHKPDSPEEDLEPDFARGVRQGPESDLEHKGRFSEGQEEFPDSPDKLVEGSFADGTEQIPRSDD